MQRPSRSTSDADLYFHKHLRPINKNIKGIIREKNIFYTKELVVKSKHIENDSKEQVKFHGNPVKIYFSIDRPKRILTLLQIQYCNNG